ncbi:tRNA (guanosine(37)-N1)-methyltransferase TrmD [Nitratiruptor sp. SB155-2]|uniref:tRNA (guanine-N(1)-)-methyltransferase n=1 Tax=Nitratiruptor sp. (strain SB155-2) TaxID=387092 RepID=TRMD_NITSB|nr:tRNA (guanosine(37)-N1)-methyltransferase TrmD [Nitratiruptor sp. SB155-2]A6Q549.1 RecName: Full=tRNA (guanine-N(1)-)-methyltransferase; AltName: Full=M1G-methyltransferase; AltName: Full=tRNA [GM37] methyltransferase [Nitratiruptor sp. SB155-2]BAF70608.1 tRNA (guanine-N1-)-methyltransferase [Nitratiruptor sp. SB155-2]
MKITYLTLFPNLMRCYFEDSILKRALEKKLFEIEFIDYRAFSHNKHKKVDRYKIGGGAGMLLEPRPIADALEFIKKKESWVVFTTPVAKRFTQKDAKRLAHKKHIVFVNGRYEGFDERLIEIYADEVFSIGDFILTGGELASLVMSDAIVRNIPGVLGNSASLEEESFEGDLLEAPSFTKPDVFKGKAVIKEFLKGNHSKISALKYQLARLRTKYYRPDKRIEDEK